MLVSKDAAKEAIAEQELHTNMGQRSPNGAVEGVMVSVERGVKVLRQTGEEVFLSQLHRRAMLLNDGFQSRILQILGLHEKATGVEGRASDSLARFHSDRASTISEISWHTANAAVVLFECIFEDGIGKVEVQQAPIKSWVSRTF